MARKSRTRTRRRRPKAKARPVSTLSEQRLNAFAESVCAVTDPFCAAARGAVWHDDTATLTLSFRDEAYVSLTTNTEGNVALGFAPSGYTTGTYGSGATLGSTITFTSMASKMPLMLAQLGTGTMARARIVSAGAEWWDIAPATAAGGLVVAFETLGVEGLVGLPWTYAAPGQGQNSVAMDRRKPGSWVSRPTSQTSYQFIDTIDAFQDASNGGSERTALLLTATGDPSTTILMVRVVINYEFEVKGTTMLNHVAHRRRDPIGQEVVDVARRVEEEMAPFRERPGKAVKQSVLGAAKAAAIKLIGKVPAIVDRAVDRYLPPSGGLPMILD